MNKDGEPHKCCNARENALIDNPEDLNARVCFDQCQKNDLEKL